jgi:hypothetical protein
MLGSYRAVVVTVDRSAPATFDHRAVAIGQVAPNAVTTLSRLSPFAWKRWSSTMVAEPRASGEHPRSPRTRSTLRASRSTVGDPNATIR